MFHWTEQKIRVHVFYCVLVLTVARQMVRQAAQRGLHFSVRGSSRNWPELKRPPCFSRTNEDAR
jgi:hypothetical protein